MYVQFCCFPGGMKLRNHRVSSSAVLSPFALLTGFQLSAQQPADPPPPSIDMQWGVKIPAPDGVSLNATVCRPHEQNDPSPVIFTFAPYIGDSHTDRATHFAAHGYLYALVNVRGRGNGEFWPFEMKTAMVSMSKNGWQSRVIATARWPRGAAPTPSIRGVSTRKPPKMLGIAAKRGCCEIEEQR